MNQFPPPAFMTEGESPRQHWRLWMGVELEGRWRGINSLFVRNAEAHEVVSALQTHRNIGHVLLGTAQIDALLKGKGGETALLAYVTAIWRAMDTELYTASNFPITLELSPSQLEAITDPALLNRCHLFLCIYVTSDARYKLKGSDTVRLDFGALCTSSVTRMHFIDTFPPHYEEADTRLL